MYVSRISNFASWQLLVWFVCGWQVKLCDPLVTHGPYLSALEIRSSPVYIKRYINSPSLLLYIVLMACVSVMLCFIYFASVTVLCVTAVAASLHF